jgi:hypothetical protein
LKHSFPFQMSTHGQLWISWKIVSAYLVQWLFRSLHNSIPLHVWLIYWWPH